MYKVPRQKSNPSSLFNACIYSIFVRRLLSKRGIKIGYKMGNQIPQACQIITASKACDAYQYMEKMGKSCWDCGRPNGGIFSDRGRRQMCWKTTFRSRVVLWNGRKNSAACCENDHSGRAFSHCLRHILKGRSAANLLWCRISSVGSDHGSIKAVRSYPLAYLIFLFKSGVGLREVRKSGSTWSRPTLGKNSISDFMSTWNCVDSDLLCVDLLLYVDVKLHRPTSLRRHRTT